MKSQDDPLSNWKRPRIVVRKRTHNEQRDLAVCIACKELKSTSLFYAALAVPTLLVDYLLWFFAATWVFKVDWDRLFAGNNVSVELFMAFVLIWTTITVQTGFLGSMVTQYLGLWLFAGDEKTSFKRVMKSWRERFFQTFYYLVLTRVFRTNSFYPEVVLLERPPFFNTPSRPSTSRRIRMINSGGVGFEAIFCFFGTELYIVSGMIAAASTLYYLTNVVVGDSTISTFVTVVFYLPILAASCRFFNVVYNFCRYINYRIVSEGWDVDLTFKTELARLGEFGTDSSGKSARSRGDVLAPLGLDAEDAPVEPTGPPASLSSMTDEPEEDAMTTETIEKETHHES